ncbi:4578_t:CDS:2, partial [Paraglomus brasilianum]
GTTASGSGTSGTQSASQEIASEDLQSGATNDEMIGIEEAPASEVADTTEETTVTAEKEVVRPQTPPQQLLQAVDPGTPTKGGKRMSKSQEYRITPPDESLPKDVQQYMIANELCGQCGCYHKGKSCPAALQPQKRFPIEALVGGHMRTKAKELKERAREQKQRQGKAASASTSKPAATAEQNVAVVVPLVCVKCMQAGHTVRNCPRSDCTHCGSKDHVGVNCPTRIRADALEIMQNKSTYGWICKKSVTAEENLKLTDSLDGRAYWKLCARPACGSQV